MVDSKQNPPISYDGEIGLRKVFRVLWAGKWLIGGVTFAAAIIAIIISVMLPDIYRAEALLAPNDQEGAGGLSALAAQYGGLASLAGINLGSGSSDKTALGIETAKSRQFVASFVASHDLLIPLMAANGWDREANALLIDADLYDKAASVWVRDVSPPQPVIPSDQEAYRRFREILHISEDKSSGFVTVSIMHYSPEIARQWVHWLVEDLNTRIQEDDINDARRAIKYLNEQLAETSLSELRQVFFDLVAEQQKTMMLASASREYVFKTIDPAQAPEKRYAPNRILIVLSAIFLGVIFGCIAAIGFPPKANAASSR